MAALIQERKFINSYLKDKKEFSLLKLKGDASERKYYRVTFKDHSSPLILMVDTPDKEKQSQDNYYNIWKHLSACDLNLPQIYHYDKTSKQMLLEDCGDTLLCEIALQGNQPQIERLYRQALDELLKIQTIGSENRDNCIAFSLAFDTEKLIWELNFFLKHVQSAAAKIREKDLNFIQQECLKICDILANEPRVLTHRDYHSKNLLVKNEQIKTIDFQDARLGPVQYDLVSLLKDSYANLDKDLVNKLTEYYLSQKEKREKLPPDRKHFSYIFDLMTFQRSLKACGTFCFLQAEKNKKEYMQYFTLALSYAKQSIEEKKEYQKLKDTLFGYFA